MKTTLTTKISQESLEKLQRFEMITFLKETKGYSYDYLITVMSNEKLINLYDNIQKGIEGVTKKNN